MLEDFDYSMDRDHAARAGLFDEVSLWSAPFGLMLLEQVKFKPRMTVLDVGFGTGFPLIELSQRLGKTCRLYGIDPWEAAVERARMKIAAFRIGNVRLVAGDAAAMGFGDNRFDLIVSNVGLNNFKEVEAVLQECFRVAKPGGQIVLTTNPSGHMKEFYDILRETLQQLNLAHLLDKLQAHIGHRYPVERVCRLLETAGFAVSRSRQDSFSMRFLDGTAFLQHYFIKVAFLPAWKEIFPRQLLNRVFSRLEQNLNNLAGEKGEFTVTIPVACIAGEKP